MPWHLGHQYEILKFPEIEWDWLIQHRRGYGTTARGDMIKDFGINLVDHYEPGKYDFALLHFDQQCFENGIWQMGKGSLFRELNELIQDIPKIIICHGTPYYPEHFPAKNEQGQDCDGISQELIDLAKKEVMGAYVIMNSQTAAKQWGFGKPIWHGMDSNEWFDLPKEPRVVTMLSPGGLDKYYDRGFLQAIRETLDEDGIDLCQITVDYQPKSWDEYRDFLGRSLIYINPTLESPMPRSRTEAMLSGCCVLTTPHQDADKFIKHGENGYIIPRNPHEVSELVKKLINNYDQAIKIGQAGNKTAEQIFRWDRFKSEWLNFVFESIDDFRTKRGA